MRYPASQTAKCAVVSQAKAEAVECAFAQSDNSIYALTANASHPKRAFLDSYLGAAHRDHPEPGCVMAALGPEIARASPSPGG